MIGISVDEEKSLTSSENNPKVREIPLVRVTGCPNVTATKAGDLLPLQSSPVYLL